MRRAHKARNKDSGRLKMVKESAKMLSITDALFTVPPEIIQEHINALGRPQKYDPEMCAKIIILMAQGRTKETAAAVMGIAYNTLTLWIREPSEEAPNEFFKPEFLTAVKIGESLGRLWWDELGRANLYNKDFNNTLYMMFRQNMHGWTRRLEGNVELKTVEEKKLTITNNTNVNIQGDEAIAEIARILVESGALQSSVKDFIKPQTN